MSYPSYPPLVIGIYGGSGSSSVADFAEALGASFARAGHIVLTGGEAANGQNVVRHRALIGARKAGGTIVGVQPSGTRPAWKSDYHEFIIDTDLRHKRNYLEACICDAAVALEGNAGTRSEVTFCLSLQKPVLLVGAGWPGDYLLRSLVDGTSVGSLIAEAFERVRLDPTASPVLDGLLNEENVDKGLQTLPPFQYWGPTPGTRNLFAVADQVVGALLGLLPAGFQPTHGSGFPDMPGYNDVKVTYWRWLGMVERRLMSQS